MIILVAPPAGPAYNFIIDLFVAQVPSWLSLLAVVYLLTLWMIRYTYPGAWINTFVAAGLIYLHYTPSEGWTSPWHTYLPIIVLYLLSNVFLAMVPFIPPEGGSSPDGYPYYVFPVVGVGVLLLGAAYWALWTKLLPRVGGYRIEAERKLLDDGVETVQYRKVPLQRGG